MSMEPEPSRVEVADLVQIVGRELQQDLTDTQRRDRELLLMYVESAAAVVDKLTLETLGEMFKLTRERVRQIVEESLARFGWTSRDLRAYFDNVNANVHERRCLAVITYVGERPGLTVKELEAVFDATLLQSLKTRITPMLLPEYPLRRERNNDDDLRREIVTSLQQAALLEYPLTGAKYDQIRKLGLVQGLSRARILQVFGTWTRACHAADVEPGETLRDSYDRRFTREELLATLGKFVMDRYGVGESVSVGSYDQYRRELSDQSLFPSSQTIRNQVHSSWTTAVHLAVEQMRRSWDN